MKLRIDQFLGLSDALESNAERIRSSAYDLTDDYDQLSELQKINVDDSTPRLDDVAASVVSRIIGEDTHYTPEEIQGMVQGFKIGIAVAKFMELTIAPGVPSISQ